MFVLPCLESAPRSAQLCCLLNMAGIHDAVQAPRDTLFSRLLASKIFAFAPGSPSVEQDVISLFARVGRTPTTEDAQEFPGTVSGVGRAAPIVSSLISDSIAPL